MVLCFGTYANAIKKCSLEGTSIQTIVSTLVQTIDKDERYSKTESYNASKIFNCNIDFAQPRKTAGESWDKGLSTILNLAPNTDVIPLAREFDMKVLKLLDEDKKILLIGILRQIIANDPSIENNKRKFQKYLNMSPSDFTTCYRLDFGLVLAGLFLYILLATKNVSEEAKETIRNINNDGFISDAKESVKELRLHEARQDQEHNRPFRVEARQVGVPEDSEQGHRVILRRIREKSMWEIDNNTYTILPPEFICDYIQYAQDAAEKYSTIKTLLTHDNPVPFYNLYVYNDVELESYGVENTRNLRSYTVYCNKNKLDSGVELTNTEMRTGKPIVISNLTPMKLGLVSRFSILTGTGGLGKSVMLQHLMYSCAMDIEKAGQIPLFVSLKDMKPEYGSLIDFIYDFNRGLFGEHISKEKLTSDLKSGGFLILLDAMDEISSSLHAQFDNMLNAFTDEFYNNQFVITSRPYNTFKSYRRFIVFTLQPLTKKQAVQLIENTTFRPAEPYYKENFLTALKKNLYQDHKSFAENPLLLNIMLMTFAHTGGISAKMHLFYRDAYKALSFDHDHNKGNYERPLATKLDPEDFGHYLEEFCAKSYKEEDYDYTWDKMDYYLRNLKIKEKERTKFTTRDFIEDLEHNLCLMYFEADEYHYVHRTFQEYFTAVYFSNKKDKYLFKIGRMFEQRAKKSRDRDIKAFEMLYGMIPEKVEEYIFLPYLEQLFKKCSDKDDVLQYFKMLDEVYGELSFTTGEVSYISYNHPHSYLYAFIGRVGNFLHDDVYESPNEDPPYAEEFAEQTYYFGAENDETGEFDIIEQEEYHASITDTDPPEVAGYVSSYPIAEIMKNNSIDSEFIDYFTDENFLYWREYNGLKKYYEKLLAETTDEDEADDLFDD
ncbi:MAG: NACHT domain-containing protein [Lachnospiraceae bacterium]|nr:NACHT domain-containing protein [Lachnospiraceae bacterium]